MATTRTVRPGLPNPKSVVAEIPFTARTEGLESKPVTYRIIRTNEVDQYEKKPTKGAVEESMMLEAKKKKAPGDQFGGTSRRAAKLSIVDAELEEFEDVADLIATLPSHQAMKKKKIPTDAKSNRVEEEQRNVRVSSAFLYAASREDDNDYHLIVGRDPNADGDPMYITMELSGLPAANAKSRKALQEARTAFKDFFNDFFGGELPGTSYDFYDPPIPMDVEGSLFWDASHASGSRPGPQSLRDDIPTVWELHPISRMELFPPE